MSFSPTVNQAPATGADAWILVITALLAAGWTLPQWSNSVVVKQTGVPVAADLQNQFAWFRLRSPADPNSGQHREFVVQNGQVGAPYYNWEYKYSARAGFVYQQLPGTFQTSNGSTTINLSVSQTIKTTQAITFANQPGVAYYLTANLNDGTTATLTSPFTGASNNFNTASSQQSIAATATLTNGLTTFTFSTNVTIPAGAAIVFAQQAAVTYYMSNSLVAGTAGILTAPYGGAGGAGIAVKISTCGPTDTPVASDEVSWPNSFDTTGILGYVSHLGSFNFPFPNDASYKFHMMVGDSAENYSWCFIMVNNASTTQEYAMAMDILNPWAGSADLDPCICLGMIGANSWLPSNLNNGGAMGHMSAIEGTPSGGYAGFASHSFRAQYCTCPNFRALPANSWSGSNPAIIPLWFSFYQGTHSFFGVGVRGWSKLMIADETSTARTNMDLATITSPGDHIWVNGFMLPWPTGVAVVA